MQPKPSYWRKNWSNFQDWSTSGPTGKNDRDYPIEVNTWCQNNRPGDGQYCIAKKSGSKIPFDCEHGCTTTADISVGQKLNLSGELNLT